jgi:hypothetical protein
MALTRDFKETIRARVKRDPGFREALLREGIENFLSGEVETGKIILRDFINSTVGFTKLSDVTHRLFALEYKCVNCTNVAASKARPQS